MKLKLLLLSAILSGAAISSRAQCLAGGCNIGLSTSEAKDGVFIGNYEQEKKAGLGITYTYNPEAKQSSYVNYLKDKKDGVEYIQKLDVQEETIVHTFKNYQNDEVVYPAFRMTKKSKQLIIEVAFDEVSGWKKYNGDQKSKNLQVKSIIHEGSPVFLAFNGKDQVMAIAATVSSIELLSSPVKEKYYSPLQLRINEERFVVDVFPKAGSYKTNFRSNVGWDMENYDDGTWIYKRYFNDELSYKFTYEDILELPSEQEIKQRKVQEAFDFVAKQVKEHNFKKGNKEKAKEFIDILADINARALNKGFTIPVVYDITMTELHLRNGDRAKSLQYAQSAVSKSDSSYKIINNLVTTEFTEYEDLLKEIKTEGELAISDE